MNNKNEINNKTKIAGITGAVIGAGVAVATAKVLSNPNARKKIKNAAVEVNSQVKKLVTQMKKQTKKEMGKRKGKIMNNSKKKLGHSADLIKQKAMVH